MDVCNISLLFQQPSAAYLEDQGKFHLLVWPSGCLSIFTVGQKGSSSQFWLYIACIQQVTVNNWHPPDRTPTPPRDPLFSWWLCCIGYFTSRPASKKYIRQATSYLQLVRQLELLTGTPGASDHLEEAVALLQHHDSITGTEKQAVANDYHKRLAKGTISPLYRVCLVQLVDVFVLSRSGVQLQRLLLSHGKSAVVWVLSIARHEDCYGLILNLHTQPIWSKRVSSIQGDYRVISSVCGISLGLSLL